ncbi:MAG: NADH-quinone oxidoreductase subunit NuoH [Chloroflexota bacterium]
MDFLNNIFTNIYAWIAYWIQSLVAGLNLPKDAESALVTAIMVLLVIIAIILWMVVMVLILIWLERKNAARIQDRVGPNRVGPWGLLQPVADTIKMFIKEDIVPENADHFVHTIAPMIVMLPAVLMFAVIPWGKGMFPVDLNIGVLWIVAVASIGTIGVFLGGYGSNNKYSLLGGMRAVAQMVSYEIPQVLTIVPIVLMVGSMSLVKINEAQSGWLGMQWFIFAFPVGTIAFVVYYLSALAEVGRTPFDIPEGESEIVAGYMTEYSGMKWALFYLAEYFNFFIVCIIGATLFLGGWNGPLLPGYVWLIGKVYALVLLGMWIRMTWPRFRVDQLMNFAWKVLVPIALVNIVLAGVALPIFKMIGF